MLTQASGCLCHYVHTEMANFILSFGASYCWHRNFLWDHLNLSILHPHLRLLSPVVLLGTDSLWLCISWLNGQVPTSLTTSYLLLLSFTILASTTVYGKVSTGLLQNSWKRIHQVCSCNLQLTSSTSYIPGWLDYQPCMTRTGSSTLVLTIRSTKGQKTALKSIRQSFENSPN